MDRHIILLVVQMIGKTTPTISYIDAKNYLKDKPKKIVLLRLVENQREKAIDFLEICVFL